MNLIIYTLSNAFSLEFKIKLIVTVIIEFIVRLKKKKKKK